MSLLYTGGSGGRAEHGRRYKGDELRLTVELALAAKLMEEEVRPGGTRTGIAGQPGDEETKPTTRAGEGLDTQSAEQRGMPKRFYGRVSLEPIRMLRGLGDNADVILAKLGRADAAVSTSIEIEVGASAGFPKDVRRTARENAPTLKFEPDEFDD